MIVFIVAGGIALRCYISMNTRCMETPIAEVTTLVSLGALELVAEIFKVIRIFRKKDD